MREDGALAYKLQSQESECTHAKIAFYVDFLHNNTYYYLLFLQLTTFTRAIAIGMRWCAKISPRLCMNKSRKRSRPNGRWRPIADGSLNSKFAYYKNDFSSVHILIISRFSFFSREEHDKRVAKEIADKLERDLQEQQQKELQESELIAHKMQVRRMGEREEREKSGLTYLKPLT